MTSNDWFFGLDAGGTKSRLFARSRTGEESFQLFGDPANIFRQGKTQVASTLSRLVNNALTKLPRGALRAIHAGIAGTSALETKKDLIDRIRLLVKAKNSVSVSISSDGLTALEGAFKGGKGLLFIAGTGSGVLARTGTAITDVIHVGGWGYLIGDEGSGYSIGKRAMTAIAHALEGGPQTSLAQFAESSLTIFDRQSLLEAISHPDWKFQHLAPEVLNAAEGGDQVAASIIREETELLAHQSKLILDRHPGLSPRFTIIGGLGNNEYYTSSLCQTMKHIWPPATFTAPLATPAEGAARLAMRSFTDSDVPQ